MRTTRLFTIMAVALLVGCTSRPVAPSNAVPAGAGTAADTQPHVGRFSGGTVTVPVGFGISEYASDLGGPRFMAVRPSDKLLFVADAQGRILTLPDANRDGRADAAQVFVSGLKQPTSIAFYQDWVYVGETDAISRYRAPNNATTPRGDREVVVGDLPNLIHWTKTIAFGPDGRLYMSSGAPCNLCSDYDRRQAAITSYTPDGKDEKTFATGLRNAVGFTWQPGTQTMWATVNGRDLIGDDLPPDELRIVRPGSFNGFPWCYNGTTPNPEVNDPSRCRGAQPSEVPLPAHVAALGLTFGEAFNAPQPYKDSIYVAYHGSWNRTVPTGYKVVRVPFANGKAGTPEDFATGWLPGPADSPGTPWGRPVDVIVGGDGVLYVSDDGTGTIYRIAPR